MLRGIKVALFVMLAAAVVSTAYGAGYASAISGDVFATSQRGRPALASRSVPPGAPPQFRVLDEVWNILQQDFVEPDTLDPDRLGKGAIDGMIQALGDAHTSFIDAESLRAEESGIRGSYEGIGASVQQAEGAIIVVAPMAGSPAEQAGVRARDRIVAVDGVTTQGMSLSDAVEKIKGPKGTRVTISVLHEGESTPQTISIVRGEIRTQSVVWEMLPEGYAHIRITQFAQRTGQEMEEALRQAKAQGAKGILLDLRNNPGGLLEATVDVTSAFMSGGVAGYQVDRNGNRTELRLRGEPIVPDLPLVVLVNAGSASGSELLAGALQDRGRASLVGTTTFGKGSVNHLRELSDGSALYVTIGRWLTPQGRQIEGKGLTPDVEVKLSEDDIRNRFDSQMDRALQVLRSRAEALPAQP